MEIARSPAWAIVKCFADKFLRSNRCCYESNGIDGDDRFEDASHVKELALSFQYGFGRDFVV